MDTSYDEIVFGKKEGRTKSSEYEYKFAPVNNPITENLSKPNCFFFLPENSGSKINPVTFVRYNNMSVSVDGVRELLLNKLEHPLQPYILQGLDYIAICFQNQVISRPKMPQVSIEEYMSIHNIKNREDAISLMDRDNRTVVVDIADFAQKRCIKDKKEARRQLKEIGELFTTFHYTISAKDISTEQREFIRRKLGDDFFIKNIRMFEECICVWGKMVFIIDSAYAQTLRSLPPMPFATSLLSISRHFTNAYYLGYYLNQLAYYKRKGEYNSSISSLLRVCPFIKKEEELSNRNFKERIVNVLVKNLDAIQNIEWKFLDDKNQEIRKDTAISFPYTQWKQLKIHIRLLGWGKWHKEIPNKA